MIYGKCSCVHCGQNIEYPLEGTGQTIPCPTCEKPVTLTPVNLPKGIGSVPIQPAGLVQMPQAIPQIRFPTPEIPLPVEPPPPPSMTVAMEKMYEQMTKLTERTIGRKLPKGDTYLHRAVMNRIFRAIPSHLLQIGLFMVKNDNGETPLHVAVRYGRLDQIPMKFLTRETLAVWENSGKTPLHIAAERDQAYRIPKEFLTPEFLSLTTKDNSANTLLHHIANADMLYLIPDGRITAEMWNAKNGYGLTPCDCLRQVRERREFLETNNSHTRARKEPVTEKQKGKLHYFGCTWDEGITKGQASDALEKCARDFPEVDRAYYGRPATEEQMAKIRTYLKDTPDEIEEPYTYGEAKDLIWNLEMDERIIEREKEFAYLASDEPRIDKSWMWINDFREVTREEVAKAWAVVKSRMADKSKLPDDEEIEDTLEELFPHFRQKGKSYPVYRCKDCDAMFKVRPPKIGAANISSANFFSDEDIIQVTIPCPGCGRNKSVESLKVCKYVCPNCSKECLVVKSQTGQYVTHSSCSKDFFATPSEPSNVAPAIRVMQYAEQPPDNIPTESQTSDNVPTKEQLQKVKELDLKLDKQAGITADKLAVFLELHGQPTREEDWSVFRIHGITSFIGDAMASYALSVLIGYIEEIVQAENWKNWDDRRIYRSCQVAMRDPAHGTPSLILDKFNRVTFSWPKRKLQEWYRKGAEY